MNIDNLRKIFNSNLLDEFFKITSNASYYSCHILYLNGSMISKIIKENMIITKVSSSKIYNGAIKVELKEVVKNE